MEVFKNTSISGQHGLESEPSDMDKFTNSLSFIIHKMGLLVTHRIAAKIK